MSFYPATRCHICNATIPSDQVLCPICQETYPCNDCTNSPKTTCMCKRWKKWFRLQWEHIHRPKENNENPPKNNENPSFDNEG